MTYAIPPALTERSRCFTLLAVLALTACTHRYDANTCAELKWKSWGKAKCHAVEAGRDTREKRK